MIVTCPECATKFNLDPKRVPGDTAKVRCSRCKFVFEITDKGKALPAIPKAERPSGPKKPPPKPVVRTPRISSLQAKRILAVGILVLIVLGAGASYWFMRTPGAAKPPAKPGETDPGNKRLALSNVEGGFEESATLGKVFVVHGLVRNDYNHAVRFIRIEGLLHSAAEAPPLKTVVVYAGNPLAEEEIRLLSEEELNLVLNNKNGKSDMDARVPPGESIPFSLLFKDLPPEMKEYTVKVLDSQPSED
ncbi:MAG: zinc-ribbon domain-containing protein [Deltaproteobacteria bacterium]|nr:zinc-ribbon domain-containing protein [Deltaproteobacteria bacterium]